MSWVQNWGQHKNNIYLYIPQQSSVIKKMNFVNQKSQLRIKILYHENEY